MTTEEITFPHLVSILFKSAEALIAKQQRIKTGLMQDLLTRYIDKHGNLCSEKTHQFEDSQPGRISVQWELNELPRRKRTGYQIFTKSISDAANCGEFDPKRLNWSEVCSKIQDGIHYSPRADSPEVRSLR